MYKQDILKQWKIIFLSSLFFYLGVLIFGLLPMYLFDDILWERNFFLIALGLIIGGTIFISLLVMLMMILLSAWPKIRKIDYLYILVILLSLTSIEIGFSEEELFSYDIASIIFIIIAVVVIGLQLVTRLMIKKTSELTYQKLWQKGIASLSNVNHSLKPKITKIMMTVLVVMVFVVLNDFSNVSDRIVTFLVIFALGFYVIKLYHECFALAKKQKIFDVTFFVLTYIGVLILLVVYSDFFRVHSVLKALLILLPFGPYLWITVPYFYSIYWLEKNRNMKQ